MTETGQPVDFFDPSPEPAHEKASYQPGNHGCRAEANRLGVLHHLNRARACLLLLADEIRANPDDDATVDAWIAQFAIETDRAGVHLQAFRDLRECQGEG